MQAILQNIRKVLKLSRFNRQLLLFLFPFLIILVVVLLYPYEQGDKTRVEVLKFLGLIVSAMVALASTSFVANFMSGLMLRLVRNFDKLDWIEVDDKFGQVTERGLFHIEIETEDSVLITLPNLYLVTRPVKVVKKAATIISATLSLGYDVPRFQVESVLKEAVKKLSDSKEDVVLENPLVHILELGDYSITYRISAVLKNVGKLFTVRSLLRCYVIDALHEANIEIVSPAFMNQRQLPLDKPIIPPEYRKKTAGKKPETEKDLEDISLTKIQRISKLEEFREKKEALEAEVEELKTQQKEADEQTAAALAKEIETLEHRIQRIASTLEAAAEEKD